jgi:enoyl-CoA hydratase
MPTYETLLYELRDGVATVTLNRPDQRNALSAQMLGELNDAFRTIKDDPDVRAAVLTGAGERVFCAGADLGGFAADVPLVHKHFASDQFVDLFKLMAELGKPTLCAANGHVLAGGMGLCLSCDLVIAREGATFGTPEINVGAFPFMVMAIIYRNVPRKRVNEMMLLGERLRAEQAVEYGLINKVVAADEFEQTVDDWARKLASKSPVLMRLGHDAIYRQQDMAFADALDYLRAQLSLAMSTEDILEGVQAFFEKREPQWKGR